MNYLTAEHITKYYGEKCLFEDLSFFIDKGHKMALVAKNGTGKSTLLRIITGEENPDGDQWKVLLHKDVKVGFLPQIPNLNKEMNVMEAVFASDNPALKAIQAYEEALLQPHKEEKLQSALSAMDALKAWDYEVKVKQILAKFKINDLDAKIGELSGGQRKRVAMASILIQEPDFLIMDEPTNHLDLEMIEWLEEYLNKQKLTLFMVTHDRYFLERVCNVILELEGGVLYKHKGNYSYFLEQKSLREEINARELEGAKKLMKKELEWMNRQPKARGTKAKSRIDKFYQIKDKASQKVDDEKVQFDIKENRLGSKILELYNVCKSYGDLKIVDDFYYKFRKRERVGIVGQNGAGKSTFLQLITGQLKPDSGRVVKGETVQFGYYKQDGIQIREDKRVIEVVKDIAEVIPLNNGRKVSASQFLERFLFTPDQQYAYVSTLSGGERRRLYLLTILLQNPNFLILDEPTNDLDIVTLNVLEDFLLEFGGCLIVVTHDRYFMDKLVEHLFVFDGDGVIKDYNGNYTEYRAQKQIEEEAKRGEERLKRQETAKVEAAQQRVEEEANQGEKLTYDERKLFKRLERDIDKLEKKKAEITEQFNDTSLTADQIEALSKELSQTIASLEEKEEQWMEMVDRA